MFTSSFLRHLSWPIIILASNSIGYLFFLKKLRVAPAFTYVLLAGIILTLYTLINDGSDYGLVFGKLLLIPLISGSFGQLVKYRNEFISALIVIVWIATLIFGIRGGDFIGHGITSVYLGAALAFMHYDLMRDQKKLLSTILVVTLVVNGSLTSICILACSYFLQKGFKSALQIALLVPVILFLAEFRGRLINDIENWDRWILSSTYVEGLENADLFRLITIGLGQSGMETWEDSLIGRSEKLSGYVLAENSVVRENMLHSDPLRMINSFGLIWTVFFWLQFYRVLGRKAIILFVESLANPLVTVNLIIISLFFVKKR